MAWTIGLACAGALVPIAASGAQAPDPLAVLVWAACFAPIAGVLAAHVRLAPLPWGAAAPSAWVLALVWSSVDSARVVPTPLWAAAAWMGLFACGAAMAELVGERSARAVYVAALVSLVLNCAAWAPGRLGAPLSPEATALCIDLSPVALVVESAGLDWQRAELLYEAAQTDRFERAAWRGELAGPLCLVLGYAGWALARVVRGRGTAA